MDPTDLDSRYHKKGEDIDVGAFAAIFEHHSLKSADAIWLELKDETKTSFLSLKLSGIEFYYGFTGRDNDVFVQTFWNTAAHLRLRSWNGAYVDVIDLINGRADIPRAGNITPISDDTKLLGSPTKRFNSIYTKILAWDTGDFEVYDKINNRLLFYINGVVRGWVDTTGFNNGIPP